MTCTDFLFWLAVSWFWQSIRFVQNFAWKKKVEDINFEGRKLALNH